jgi:hypothetical protein
MTTNTHQINWFVTAGTLRAAFTECKRTDGSTYWATTEQVDNDDLLTDFIRDLHDDEMPNDWRYETIVDICNYLCDLVETIDSQSDAHDIAFSAADSITSIYTSELCKWLGENTGRLSYIDDAQEEGLIPAEADTFKRLQIGQFECIRSMAVRIIDRLVEGK